MRSTLARDAPGPDIIKDIFMTTFHPKCRAALLLATSCLWSWPVAAQDAVLLDPISLRAWDNGAQVDGYKAITTTSATRTETPLMETPQSVQVLSRDLLQDQGPITMAEALRNVSGAQGAIPLQTPAFESTTLRGFPAEFYRDGMTNYINTGDANAMATIDRIEVLKGQNALLYGGGVGTPLGGVVNIVSRQPVDRDFTTMGLSYGSDSYVEPSFDINRRLTQDGRVLFRMSGSHVRSDSAVDVIDTTRYSFSPAITFGHGTDTSLTVQAYVSKWQQQEYQALPAVGTVTGDFRLPRDLYIGDPDIPDSVTRTRKLTFTLEHRFNEDWSSRTQFRYGRNDVSQITQIIISNTPDAGGRAWNLYNSYVPGKQTEYSLSSSIEGRITTGAVEHRLLFGADYSRLDDWSLMYMDLAGTQDLLDPADWPRWTMPAGLAMTDGDARYETAGAYAQVQSSIGDRLHLLAGVRLAHLSIDSTSINYDRTDTLGETRLLPRLGVVWQVNDGLSTYASYSEGMKANAFLFYAGQPKPEFSRQAEIGVKFDTDRGLSGSLAAYRIERENVPVTNPDDPMFLTMIPEGQQRSKGFEADVIWQPGGPVRLIANYAYTDAKLTRDIPMGASAGSDLPGIPRHSGGLWVDYDARGADGNGWRAGAGLHAVSASYVDQANQYETSGYTTIDASASYSRDDLSVSLYVKNLADRDYDQPFYKYLDGRVAPGSGRQVVLSLGKTF